MRSTLDSGASEVKGTVSKTVGVGIGVPVDMPQLVPVKASQRRSHLTSQAPEPSVVTAERSAHLSQNQVAITFDEQSRGTMVDCALYPHQQSCVLSSVIRFTAGGEKVRARPHHGAARVEESRTSAALARVPSACTVETQQPWLGLGHTSRRFHRWGRTCGTWCRRRRRGRRDRSRSTFRSSHRGNGGGSPP